MNYYYDCEVLGDRYEEMEELIKESNAMDSDILTLVVIDM